MSSTSFQQKGRYGKILLLALAFLFLVGMGGYMVLEDMAPLQALYLTIGTLTTVAPFNLSEGGRLFAIILILFGFGLVTATATYLGHIILEGNVIEQHRRRKLHKTLQSFSDHYIICGYGQMGHIIAEELFHKGLSIVVIDKDEEAIQRCKELGIFHLERDAMEEDYLLEAGIERAKGLISVVNRDADNVFIVLTARALNPDMQIFARASSKGVEKKLFRAGADHVVSPYASAAIRITQNVLRPTITDFLELALSGKGIDLELEELEIPGDAPFAGSTIMDTNIRNDYDLIIVALKRADGTRVYNPSSLEPVHPGDTIIAIGPQTNMDRLYKRLYGRDRNTGNRDNA